MFLAVLVSGTFVISSVDAGGPSLKMQKDWGYDSEDFGCWYHASVLVERPNGKFACVYPYTAIKLGWDVVINDTNSAFIETKVNNHDILAYFSGSVIGNTITYNENDNSLVIDVFTKTHGKLSLAMPTDFAEMQTAYCPEPRTIDDYFVLIDGEEVAFEKKISDNTLMYLEVSYPVNGGRIEVIATCPMIVP